MDESAEPQGYNPLPGPLPSLEYLNDHITRLGDAQAARLSDLNSRGGVLLGFSGLLVGAVFRAGVAASLLLSVAGLAAGAAAVLAGLALLPRGADDLNSTDLINEYASLPVHVTQLSVLSTLASIQDEREKAVGRKARRLRWATALLGVAVVLLVGEVLWTSSVAVEVLQWIDHVSQPPSPGPCGAPDPSS